MWNLSPTYTIKQEGGNTHPHYLSAVDINHIYCGTGILPVQYWLFWRCLVFRGHLICDRVKDAVRNSFQQLELFRPVSS